MFWTKSYSSSRNFYFSIVLFCLLITGGFVANVLLGGLGKSYSLVMEAFQEVFECGSAYLFLAGGLIYTLMYCLCKFLCI